MAAKLTPWFHGSVKPVHVGVYERDIGIQKIDYAYWTGKKWWTSCSYPAGAAVMRSVSGFQPNSKHGSVPWRGLAQKPAKKAKGR